LRPYLSVTDDEAVTADAAKLEAIYTEQGPRLWRSLYLSTGDREVASDAAAEAFAQALRRGDALHSPERWVWKAAFRIARGELAARSRVEYKVEYQDEAVVGIPDETLELLMALGQLSRIEREAVVLHYYADRSIREIARITGSKQSAVGVRLHRAKKRLRELMEVVDV
jgi:RNA polymerase sigma-70 factor (ECF subfamily)